jgi:hypothetical protein
MGFEFIPLGDIQDDPEAIVARIRSIADQDTDMLDSVNTNIVVQEEDDDLLWRNKVIPRSRHGHPH